MTADGSSLPNVLCCECGVSIAPNPTMMCIGCLRVKMDITQGINTTVTLHQCRSCQRWLRPPFVNCELESRELMALCLRKINGLNKVKLVDAQWIWTEPHSKRLKIKLTIQKEVINGAILQQALVCEFIIRNQQCSDCQRSYAEGSWMSLVQVRQRVEHKRTFYYLEQVLLKNGAHTKASNIAALRDGMDFYFETRSHGQHFQQFLESTVPCRSKSSRKLVGADLKSNKYNFKYTLFVEIAPVCKDDLVYIPPGLSSNLSNISRLCVIQRVNREIVLIDPISCQRAMLDAEKFWKYPFEALKDASQLQEYIVLGSEPLLQHGSSASASAGGSSKRRADVSARALSRKHRLAEVTIARTRDLGQNDTSFVVLSHLGHLLSAGDAVLGYDLASSNLEHVVPLAELPDVILVRKRRGHGGKRAWKVRGMEDVVAEEEHLGGAKSKKKRERQAMQQAELERQNYEAFLEQVENDTEMRHNMNIYKKAEAEAEHEAEDEEDIQLDELLDELTLDDGDADPDEEPRIFAHAEAAPAANQDAEDVVNMMSAPLPPTEEEKSFMPAGGGPIRF